MLISGGNRRGRDVFGLMVAGGGTVKGEKRNNRAKREDKGGRGPTTSKHKPPSPKAPKKNLEKEGIGTSQGAK